MKIAILQHDIAWEDRDRTLAALEPLLVRAAAGGARLALCTELFAVGFTLATDVVAEPEDGPTTTWMRAMATAHDLWIAGSVPEVAPGATRPANVFVLAGPDGTVHRYRKVHTFTHDGEDQHYERGTGTITVEVEGLRCTPMICYDLRFADQWWDAAAGTDCYLLVASWPPARRAHWRALVPARAIENQAYVVAANRVGEGGGLDYRGDSLAVDPWGEVLVDGDTAGEAVLFVEVDPQRVREVRSAFPVLGDR